MQVLRATLAINAISCIGFGLVFMLAAGPVATFLAPAPVWLMAGIGAGLVVNGWFLARTARASAPARADVLWFSAGDLAWWTVSCAVLAFPVGAAEARAAIWAVALLVATLGLIQVWCLARMQTDKPLAKLWRDWLQLPLWVQVWLILLNALFLAAIFVLDDDLARPVAQGYIASGPLLVAIALWSGGLTRVVGVGHLVPWVPLLPVLWQGVADSTLALALLIAVVVCLGFDLFDLGRWWADSRRGTGTQPHPPGIPAP